MVKTRVHDLAAEFGVAPEQLLGMLKEMNIFVRSHLSALEHDQVSAVRVRWEREKRKSAEEPAAKKGRRRDRATTARGAGPRPPGCEIARPPRRPPRPTARRSDPGRSRGAGASRKGQAGDGGPARARSGR